MKKFRNWLEVAGLSVALGLAPGCGDDDDDAVSTGGRTGTGGASSAGSDAKAGATSGGRAAGGSSNRGGASSTNRGGASSQAGSTNEAGAGLGGAGGEATLGDLVDTALGAAPEFESLVAALTQAELVDTLKGPGPFTVFAPTDAAFSELLETLDVELGDLTREDLTPILLYHVIPGAVSASSVTGLTHATSASGSDFSIRVDDGKVLLNGDVQVVTTDIRASNGVIHVIDKVLVPPGDIPTVASGLEDFQSLAAALTKADLIEALEADGPFTVFAPTDQAFTAFLNGIGKSLDDLTPEDLTPILLYHVVPGKVYSDAAVALAGKSAETLNEEASIAISVSGGSVKLNSDTTVTATDIVASNGVIHVIDKVLTPE